MGIRQTFSDFHPWTRRLLAGSFILGWALTIGFALTDVGYDLKFWGWDPKPEWLRHFNSEWLHEQAYIPNVLAAMTGFLIGVPVALVVLAAFTGEREERAQKVRVDRQSAVAWVQFRNAAVRFANIDRIKALNGDARIVQSLHDGAITLLQDYRESMPDLPERLLEAVESRESRRGSYEVAVGALVSHTHEWLQALEIVDAAVGSRRQVQVEWSILRTHWATLDQYIRLQRLGIGQPLFRDEEHTAYLRDFLDSNLNPLSIFLDAHEDADFFNDQEGKVERSPYNMAAACHAFWEYAELPLWEFEFRCGRTQGVDITFPHVPVKDYLAKAHTAERALSELRQRIQLLESHDWPADARKLAPNMPAEENGSLST